MTRHPMGSVFRGAGWRLGALLVAASFVGAGTAGAQASVTIEGAATSVQVAPGKQLTIPIVVDMSRAGGSNVSFFSTGILWNPGVLTFDSIRATPFGTITPILTNAAAGNVQLKVTAATPTTSTQTAANVFFTASDASGGTVVQLPFTVAGNPIGAIAAGQVLGRNVDVCVAAQGIWGDANADGSVDIIDAQQIARSVVGLSVVSPAAVAEQGDVNADSTVNVIDAQLIARYAVDLSAPPRINTSQGATPPVANVALNRASASVALGQTLAISATPQDADGFPLTGCAPVSWSSSDPTKVAVNESGLVRAVAGGTALITATSGGVNAQASITVSVPDATAALLRLRNITAGGNSAFLESAWLLGGLLTDEWKSSDTFTQRNGIDQRSIPDNDVIVQSMLRELYRARSDARAAFVSLAASGGAPQALAQLQFMLGYVELMLAETFCNGVPLNELSSTSLMVNGPPLSNATLFTRAIAHFDSAMALASATDSLSAPFGSPRVGKARALLGLGQFAVAATVAAGVPTPFRDLSTLGGAETNKIWLLNASVRRWTVGDSFDLSGVIGNATPFASATDPRLPVNGTTGGTSPAGRGFDQITNLVVQQNYLQFTPTPLLSGIDARLIEAEARLNAADLVGMVATLNALRVAPQNLGAITTPPMPALAQPASQNAAIALFFREKAFWTFARGQRLGDLRRLVRLYGRLESAVFPTGTFFKGGTYGSAVNFPAAVDEDGNILPTVCIDRSA